MVTMSPFNYAAHWPVCLTAMSVLQICHDDDNAIVCCTLSIDTRLLMLSFGPAQTTRTKLNTHAHRFNSTIIPDNLLLLVKKRQQITDIPIEN